MTRLLELDARRLEAVFGRTSMSVRHGLSDHPLLTLDSLADLADRLPERNVEHNIGKLAKIAAAEDMKAVESTSPGEVVRNIEANGSWVVLKNVEQDPEYKALLDACLDETQQVVGHREGGMRQREAFIFLSAPDSMTPSHCDPEHNFLLQVRGTKEMHVGRFDDPEVEATELERIYLGGHRNIGQQPDQEECYALAAGEGVYVRPDAPHYVQNGPSTSISFSITWRTPVTQRKVRVHQANGWLRKLRVTPRPPGADRVRDRFKELGALAMLAVERVAERVRPAAKPG